MRSYTKAHQVLETICLDRDTQPIKELIASALRNLYIFGQWFTPLRELSAFVDKTQETVTGSVTLKLYKGNMINAGVTSPYSLYSEEIATFDEDHVYDQSDAEGFINLFWPSIKVKAMMEQKQQGKKKEFLWENCGKAVFLRHLTKRRMILIPPYHSILKSRPKKKEPTVIVLGLE